MNSSRSSSRPLLEHLLTPEGRHDQEGRADAKSASADGKGILSTVSYILDERYPRHENESAPWRAHNMHSRPSARVSPMNKSPLREAQIRIDI